MFSNLKNENSSLIERPMFQNLVVTVMGTSMRTSGILLCFIKEKENEREKKWKPKN